MIRLGSATTITLAALTLPMVTSIRPASRRAAGERGHRRRAGTPVGHQVDTRDTVVRLALLVDLAQRREELHDRAVGRRRADGLDDERGDHRYARAARRDERGVGEDAERGVGGRRQDGLIAGGWSTASATIRAASPSPLRLATGAAALPSRLDLHCDGAR